MFLVDHIRGARKGLTAGTGEAGQREDSPGPGPDTGSPLARLAERRRHMAGPSITGNMTSRRIRSGFVSAMRIRL
ncbi:hypothetical protein Mnod_6352 [Methylobacterium nodulans ORS 2060]|uniref:Uncharacterized protein n=1 Tax=Methylobacterium nodulans (strain LMG 21967 / CNCM I-2342 / ORS 2060) TaxID=460265 RepID=B8IBV7_METNO|nr:hypothetical protein Mnod_6352 [Methylobacterium nodulans ORS 2060]